jgi:hypothetical protein
MSGRRNRGPAMGTAVRSANNAGYAERKSEWNPTKLLTTSHFWRDFQAMRRKGVHFCEEPRYESYGTVAVFEDLYGNRWDLLQLKR